MDIRKIKDKKLKELALKRREEDMIRDGVRTRTYNLSGAFTWFKTLEGRDFWRSVEDGITISVPVSIEIEPDTNDLAYKMLVEELALNTSLTYRVHELEKALGSIKSQLLDSDANKYSIIIAGINNTLKTK